MVGAQHAGIWVEWGGPRRFEPFGADSKGIWNGIQVKRPAFDGLLLHAALAAGVEVRQPAVVIGAAACVGGGWVVETSTGQVIARMVLDASGRSRWLSRLLSIASPGRSKPLIARYGYVGGSSLPIGMFAPLLLGESHRLDLDLKRSPRASTSGSVYLCVEKRSEQTGDPTSSEACDRWDRHVAPT